MTDIFSVRVQRCPCPARLEQGDWWRPPLSCPQPCGILTAPGLRHSWWCIPKSCIVNIPHETANSDFCFKVRSIIHQWHPQADHSTAHLCFCKWNAFLNVQLECPLPQLKPLTFFSKIPSYKQQSDSLSQITSYIPFFLFQTYHSNINDIRGLVFFQT